MDIYLARQPIFDREQQVAAYELLYRAGNDTSAEITDPDLATLEVLTNTFMDFGLDKVTGKHRAYINLTRPFLLGKYPLPFGHHNITLEILENIEPDPELVEGVRKLSQQGYEIALDDFVFSEKYRPLLEFADVVKLDIRQLETTRLQEHVSLLKSFNVTLLAEKVETHEEYAYCRELGFDLFQGYFFCRPHILQGKQASPSRLASMRLLSEINTPDYSLDDLVKVISTDNTLAYKLLRYINSAYFGLGRKIESIRHALVLLGQNNIRSWLNFIALSQMEDKNSELIMTSLVRARLCEILAGRLSHQQELEKFFLVGLFSTLDAFVDMPMVNVLESISLSDDLTTAILEHEGIMGKVLDLALHAKRGEWQEMNLMGLTPREVSESLIDAIEWSEKALQVLSEY